MAGQKLDFPFLKMEMAGDKDLHIATIMPDITEPLCLQKMLFWTFRKGRKFPIFGAGDSGNYW